MVPGEQTRCQIERGEGKENSAGLLDQAVPGVGPLKYLVI